MMPAASPPPDATGQLGRAAGIGAVALAVLVAIAVAGLFLVLIGVQRSDRPPAPGALRVPASSQHTERPRQPLVVIRSTSARRSESTTR